MSDIYANISDNVKSGVFAVIGGDIRRMFCGYCCVCGDTLA
jgi:hypothetical protein